MELDDTKPYFCGLRQLLRSKYAYFKHVFAGSASLNTDPGVQT
jgi:hypothetical protein